MHIASELRVAARQALPTLPVAPPLEHVAGADGRLERAFDDPDFEQIRLTGTLRAGHDARLDFIYGPNLTHAAGTDLLGAVAAAHASAAATGGVAALAQGRDGVYYLDLDVAAGYARDGGGATDWLLRTGDLATVTVDAPEVVAVVDGQGWFDLRAT